jgi:hypothetical protein
MSQRIVRVVTEGDVISGGVFDVNRPAGLFFYSNAPSEKVGQQRSAIGRADPQRNHCRPEIIAVFHRQEPRQRIAGGRQREPDASQASLRAQVARKLGEPEDIAVKGSDPLDPGGPGVNGEMMDAQRMHAGRW